MLLCPLEAGKVVTEAKSLLLVHKDEYHEYDHRDCQKGEPRTKRERGNSDHVYLYPNPGVHSIRIHIPEDVVVTDLIIKNAQGSEVLGISHGISLGQIIDVSGLRPGIYFYEVQTEDQDGTYTGKLILIE